MDGALKASAEQPFGARAPRRWWSAMLTYYERHWKFVQILMQGETGRYQRTFPTLVEAMRHKMREVRTRMDKLIAQGVREKAIRAELSRPGAVLPAGDDAVAGHAPPLPRTRARGWCVEADRMLDAFLHGVGAGVVSAAAGTFALAPRAARRSTSGWSPCR